MYIFIDLDRVKDKGIIKSEFLANIREYFSVADDKADLKKHMFRKYDQNRFIPKRKYIITETGRFDMGLLVEILKYLKSLNTPFKIVFSEDFKQRYHTAYPYAEEPLVELKLPLRDYQTEGVRKALKNGNGIELVPTGSGKTLMMASIAAKVLEKTPTTKVLLVTPTHLINQTYGEFLSYGFDPQIISRWSGEEDLNQTSNIIICGSNIITSKIENTALELKKAKLAHLKLKRELETKFDLTPQERSTIEQTIQKIEKDIPRIQKKDDANKKIHNFLETVGLLLVDEVHTFKRDNNITDLINFIPSRNRFGFTGTLPEDKIDEWTIIGKIGPVIHEVNRQVLVEEKHIADVDVRILQLHYKDVPYRYDNIDSDEPDSEDDSPTSKYEAELSFIQNSVFRNNVIKKISEKLDKNILIVVDRIAHGDNLLAYLGKELPNKKVYFIKGEVEDVDRDKIQALMEKEDNVVCIAISKIFSTGISIKNLHYIIFASAGKAKVKTVQTIGRGVRMIQEKIKVVIFDLADYLYYGCRHLKQRKEIYDNEQLKYRTIDIKET